VPENYIHRIGRTGRFDKKGIAITFSTPKEASLLEAIESLMQYQVPVVTIPADVEISSVLTEDEIPKVIMKEIFQKVKKVVSTAGPAFHEKSAKNSKSNEKSSRRDVMQKKYKPIKRGAKKK
jgi:ATP-dependent RNA helicase RhlE